MTANDGVNPPVSDTALVTVIQPNTPPTVNAGPDLIGTVSHAVALDGTVTDPDNTPIVHWATGNSACSFGNANVVDTTITCTTTGIFAVTLTADDGVNAPVSDTALVKFTPPVCVGTCLAIGDAFAYEGGVLATADHAQLPRGAWTRRLRPPSSAETATNPADYKAAVTHNITIKANKREVFLNVTTLRDAVAGEGNETFHVDLSAAQFRSQRRTLPRLRHDQGRHGHGPRDPLVRRFVHRRDGHVRRLQAARDDEGLGRCSRARRPQTCR